MAEGEINMQILLVCQFYFVYSKKKVYKRALKEAKINLEYRRSESNLGRLRASQVS